MENPIQKTTAVSTLDKGIINALETPSIKLVAPYLFKLAKEILESGKTYDLVVGDDTSARLPSLFFKAVLDGIKEKKSLPKTRIIFVTPRRYEFETVPTDDNIIGRISRQNSVDRVLVVTEQIHEGENIVKLIEILIKTGKSFDIAAVSTTQQGADTVKNIVSSIKHVNFYYGQIGHIGADTFWDYSKRKMSGVERVINMPHPIKTTKFSQNETERKTTQTNINQARQDIYKLAEGILKMKRD